jgi:hypothetical protein
VFRSFKRPVAGKLNSKTFGTTKTLISVNVATCFDLVKSSSGLCKENNFGLMTDFTASKRVATLKNVKVLIMAKMLLI